MESSLSIGQVDTTLRGNIRYLTLCVFMGMLTLESGLDSGCIGGYQAMVGFLEVFGYRDPTSSTGWNIKTGPQQLISSFMTIGSALGALAIGPVSTKMPRLWVIGVGSVCVLVSAAIQAGTTSLGALYFGRLLIGIGNGIITTCCVIYIQETAPPHLRSLSSGILQSFLGVGSLLGTVIDNATADITGRLCYQIPLFIILVIPAFFLASIPFLPESPRWLLQHHKEDAALRSLTRLRRGTSDEIAITEEFEKMKFWETRELEMMSGASWKEMFRGTNLRRTVLSCGISMSPSATGAMFVLIYSTYFFEMAGVTKPFQDSVVAQCLGLAGTYLSFVLIRSLGTKIMLLSSTGTCCLSMLAVGIAYSASHGSAAGLKVIVGMVSLFMFGFNAGIAIYSFPVAAELPAQKLRAYTMGLAVALSYVFSWVTTFTAPYFINSADLNWGPKYGYIWFGSSFVLFIFIYFLMPDLSGLSLDDIDSMFEAKIPARQFQKYVYANNEVVLKSKVDVEDIATKPNNQDKPDENILQ